MGWYAQVVFPRLCDWLLNQPAIAAHRQALLAGTAGDVLEIGFGTGLNLPYYPAMVHKLTIVDPNPGMHRLAARRLRDAGLEVDRHVLSGEALPFPDLKFDCVVCTFTLCSIPRPEQAIAEAHRVLRPGGRFLFLEHGLSPEPRVQAWQRRLNWLERRLGDGCQLDRDVKALIDSQPFASVELEESYLRGAPRTHGYLYRGVAAKES